MSINRVILVGRLTRDPESRQTTTGKTVANFGIAVQKRFKTEGEPDAEFFNVSAWGQQADYITNYGGKGRLVSVDGRLSSRKYTTQNGDNREVVEVVAESLSLLDSPREDRPKRRDTDDNGMEDEVGYDPFADE